MKDLQTNATEMISDMDDKATQSLGSYKTLSKQMQS